MVLGGELLPELDHFFGVVDGDDLLGSLGEELGEGSFARSEVGDDLVVEYFEQSFGESFPGATGHIVTAKLSRKFVKIGAREVFALAENEGESFLVR